jgi:hypothetical protein
VATSGGAVLIDPLPLADDALEQLAPVEAICLTSQCHQRCAWRYRDRFGARVYAPATRPMEQEPDEHGTGPDAPDGASGRAWIVESII